MNIIKHEVLNPMFRKYLSQVFRNKAMLRGDIDYCISEVENQIHGYTILVKCSAFNPNILKVQIKALLNNVIVHNNVYVICGDISLVAYSNYYMLPFPIVKINDLEKIEIHRGINGCPSSNT